MKTRHAVLLAFWDVLTPRQVLILTTLRKLGWRLTVIGWDRDDRGEQLEVPKGLVDDVALVRLAAPTWSVRLLLRLPWFYARLLDEVRTRADTDLWILTHYFLLPLSPFLSGKVMYDAAESYAQDLGFYMGRARRVATAVFGVVERLMTWFVDGISTVDSVGDWLGTRYRNWGRRVEVLWNVPSVADDLSTGPAEEWLDDIGDRRVVAFAGGLMKDKGLRVALRAAARVRERHEDVLFVFLGKLKDDRDAISELVEGLEVGGVVRFVDPMPYPDLVAFLKRCEVGLALYHPTYHYQIASVGNARKIFTYMQAGLPVVAPSFGEIGRAVEENSCGMLVDTEDEGEVANAIISLLDDPASAREIGNRGREAVRCELNWEHEEVKLIRLVSALCP